MDLKKALYGLKRSGLLWNDLLVDELVSVHGMEQCMTDPGVFRLIRVGKLVLILAVHVDDMAVAGTRVEVNKLRSTKTLRRMTSESCLSLRDVPPPKTLRRV